MSIFGRSFRRLQELTRSPRLGAQVRDKLARAAGLRVQPGQIDVRDLLARYDYAHHAKLADQYFEHLLNDPVIRRKPFAHLGEAIQIMNGFSYAMEGLRLFPAADVLDFGAGTCWSSRILSCVGCRVTALDVSANALRIGKSIQEQDLITRDLPIGYQVFDGRSIPLANESFDRIMSYDAFHHVADQRAVLSEFARVLRDDGIAAFAEPGPQHSLTASSQMEMKAYGVIENDIRVEEIWDIARDSGFTDIKMSFAMPRQELISLQEFNQILETESAPDHIVFSPINRALHANRRVFFLYKSRALDSDSRFAEGLHHRMRLIDATPIETHSVRLQLGVTNSGTNAWRPSGSGTGSVNVGVHLKTPDGRIVENDFSRLTLSGRQVAPGEQLTVTENLILPALDDFDLELDLVAENVTWFEIRGATPLTLKYRNRMLLPI